MIAFYILLILLAISIWASLSDSFEQLGKEFNDFIEKIFGGNNS